MKPSALKAVGALLLLAPLVLCQFENCGERRTCGDCMADAECFWCLDNPEDVANFPKCFSKYQEHQCQNMHDPPGSSEVLESAELNPNAAEDIVQISPQSVNVEVRPLDSDGLRVPFSIAQSSQYPVDIYFLLDLSFSMESSRDNFAQQAGDIIDGIKSISGNLHVGFGSFVEKNLPPFTSAVPSFNCPADDPNCTPPYSYYHRVTLGEMSADEFKAEVLAAPLAGNVDEPEGGLDALMQVMVCQDRVGWRRDSRKIILLATDRDYHFAMDGKLAGILDRNDGLCHLNGTEGGPGYYTHSVLLDYPSVSQIGAAARGSSFVVIFAVIPQYKQIWEALSNLVTGSYVEILEEDAANIVELIEERYEEITSSIQVNVENVPADVSVVLKSKCSRRLGEEVETDRCLQVELGTPVEFVAEVRARKCLDPSDGPHTFTISPVGISQELTVTVDTICDCPCEFPGGDGFERDAASCSGRGDNECGVCDCRQGFSGAACECDESRFEDVDDLNVACRDPDTPELVCNGLGSCQCGACVCFDPARNYGVYCECDDTTCPRDAKGRLCSSHGRCSCGKCVCSEGWTGVDCSCSTGQDLCMSPYNAEMCSGDGECLCNACRCRQDEEEGGLFSGAYCEKAPGEVEPCLVLRDCVECLAFNSGPLASGKENSDGSPVCPAHCDALEYSEVPAPNATDAPTACEFENDAGCRYRFTSVLSPEKQVSVLLLLTDDGEKEVCPNVNTLAISLSMFGLILLLGLLTLFFWKCYIVVDDRRMYAKFEKEAKELKFAANQNANDIYKSPITEYKNPMYGKAIN